MPTCGKNEILRSSYKRKTSKKKISKVKASCIKDKGKKGKGKKLFEIKDKGFLRAEGYALNKPEKTRHESLRKASREKGTLKVLRHLNAIRTLQKNNPEYYKKLDNDVKYIQKIYS